jgi:hypothetical protein
MGESTSVDEELHQQWLSWARRNHLGNERQLLAAAQAAVEAASRGATSEDAARAARQAAAGISDAAAGRPPDQNQAKPAIQPELSPGGITWGMAMDKAGQILARLPEAKQNNSNVVTAQTSMAQAWIAFAREVPCTDA